MERDVRFFFENLVFEIRLYLSSLHQLEERLPGMVEAWGVISPAEKPFITENASGFVEVQWLSIAVDPELVGRDRKTIVLVDYPPMTRTKNPKPAVVNTVASSSLSGLTDPSPSLSPHEEERPEPEPLPGSTPGQTFDQPPEQEVETLDLNSELVREETQTLDLYLVGDDGRNLAGCACRVRIGEEIRESVVDTTGQLSLHLPKGLPMVRLEVDMASGKTLNWLLRLGPAPPVREMLGTQSRLNQLGFFVGQLTGDLDPITQTALKSFQMMSGHPSPSGRPDALTSQSLVALAGVKEAQ